MQTHPFYTNILLHSDDELADELKAKIIERETIHEWPLSCVQRIVLGDGVKLIYKSQLPPSVEPGFYECGSSEILPHHRLLQRLGNCETMTIEWIEAPLLRDAVKSAGELLAHGHNVLDKISQIKGDLPVQFDISTAELWLAAVERTFAKLESLMKIECFTMMSRDAVEKARKWTHSQKVIDTIVKSSRVIHGDLKSDHILVTSDGYRVIDWQRPVKAPPDVDLVSIFVGDQIDPRRYLGGTVIGIFWFLRLYWAVEGQFDIFPDFKMQVLDYWSAEAIDQIIIED